MKNIGAVILDYKSHEQVIELCNLLMSFNIFNKLVIVNNTLDKFNYGFDKNILIIENQKNLGYGKAINVGIKSLLSYSMIDLFLLINSDIKVSKETILSCADHIDNKHPISSCLMRDTSDVIDQTFWNLPRKKDYFKNCFYFSQCRFVHKRKRNAIIAYEKSKNRIIEVDAVRESFMLLDSNFIRKYGPLFDENIFMYCEADSIAFNLKQKELKINCILDESYFHYHKYTNAYKNSYYIQSSKYILIKYLHAKFLTIVFYDLLFFLGNIERFFIHLFVKLKRKIHGK